MQTIMDNKAFTAYDYKERTADKSDMARYIDCYECFGWRLDDKISSVVEGEKVTLHFRRDRNIANKAELTRLAGNFEACMDEIKVLKDSKKQTAQIVSLTAGMIGTAFMAGSTFAATAAERPIIWLCALLAVPGIALWTAPYFIYKHVLKKREEKITPLIEAKYDEIYRLCEKGNGLI